MSIRVLFNYVQTTILCKLCWNYKYNRIDAILNIMSVNLIWFENSKDLLCCLQTKYFLQLIINTGNDDFKLRHVTMYYTYKYHLHNWIATVNLFNLFTAVIIYKFHPQGYFKLSYSPFLIIMTCSFNKIVITFGKITMENKLIWCTW